MYLFYKLMTDAPGETICLSSCCGSRYPDTVTVHVSYEGLCVGFSLVSDELGHAKHVGSCLFYIHGAITDVSFCIC